MTRFILQVKIKICFKYKIKIFYQKLGIKNKKIEVKLIKIHKIYLIMYNK
jgi:hypothetical protein